MTDAAAFQTPLDEAPLGHAFDPAGRAFPPRSLQRVPALTDRLGLPLLLLLLVVPLTLTDLPPLLDYPNHLARMHVLLTAATHPAVGAMYQVHWQLIPNIGMDLVVPLLAQVMPLDVAGRLFMAAALLLPVAGTVMLHRALFAGRSPWPLVAGVVAYNGIFFAGFMNYLAANGLALIAAALWLRLRPPLLRLAVATVLSAVIFFCHFLGWVFFGLLLASLEVMRLRGRLRYGRALFRETVPPLAFAALPLLPELVSMAARATTLPPPSTVPDANSFLWWHWKLVGLLSPTLGYVRWLDVSALALLLLALALPAARRHLSVAWTLAPALAVLGGAFLVLPFCTHTAAFIDTRIPILGVFLVIAMTSPAALPRPLVAALAAVAFARLAVVAYAFNAHNADLAGYRAAIADIPAGSRVAVVTARGEPPRGPEPISRNALMMLDALTHVAGLLLIEHDAFWPLLFHAPGKQPVLVRPPYDRLAMPESWLASWRELSAPTPEGRMVAPYLAHWRRDFDFVVCVYANRLADPAALAPAGLQLVRANHVAALYRVIHAD
jgi:hypothetical protein